MFQCLGVCQRLKGQRANKQFKWDSARVAFLVCGGFGVEVPCSNVGIACFTP
ncbi:DUF3265 domain-containing protein [Vibrio parahaemolyticus]|nr:DUF3265 domain-containing protein [Vibrio parahaemolyticus]EGQ7859369.1 DUF3265 domain-containing protein [Vibrio parahaemolyticus]TOF18217.1 DUF3265 domain-containing protein [Vibrio parahaemolyticus]TOQ03309.1 DUF3265 domain-containing protein [Vibrio parahaemolyticus]TOR12085.1 DUF3265 domain-containing protein [Vibrio parahaemolyticus]HCG7916562.1 DUF3265 domain-containing protein [Vibrio parahaemolyticus]